MSLLNNELAISRVELPQFDVVSDISDHRYAGKPSWTGSSGGAQKKIMKEWKLLEKNLPESIFVTVYETRVDLLRAAIVGARGTPYHDGLFFFDIHFPSDYPAHPPSINYRSFGLRINPNLYAGGKVCLSLLNTWNGKKSERWDPNTSNILQVLLSIQALVLNEKPYFNEPGYGPLSGRTFGEKKALAYNEDVFILTCKTMLYVLRSPPRHFEPIVHRHFTDRAEFILSACNGYRKGLVTVGQFGGGLNTGRKVHVSSKFRGIMDQVYRELVGELARRGASVGQFVQELRWEEEERAATKEGKTTKAGSGDGVGKTFVKKLKKILFMGFKNNHKSKTTPVPVI